MEDGDQEQVAGDVTDAGDGDCDQGGDRVADPAENAADEVIGDDHEHACPADPDIGRGEGEGLRRGVHDLGDEAGAGHAQGGEDDTDAGEEDDAGADGRPALFRLAAPDLLAQQDRRAHGEAGHQVGQGQHDLRPCCDGRDVGRHLGGVGEASDDHEIDCAVHRLQEEGRQDRQGKLHQGQEDLSLREGPDPGLRMRRAGACLFFRMLCIL